VSLTTQWPIDLPAFAPDGKRFVVNLFAVENCALAPYVAQPPYDNSRLVTELVFTALVAPHHAASSACAVDGVMTDVSWSPDANCMALIAGRQGAVWERHHSALGFRTIALPSEVATARAMVITIPSSVVHDLGLGMLVEDGGTHLTWAQVADTVSPVRRSDTH
jgi:hypothetical protein